MRRREVVAGLGAAAALPLVAGAQQAPGLPRIGLLWALAPPSRVVDAFRSALADLGYVDDRTAVLEFRSQEINTTGCPRSRPSSSGWMLMCSWPLPLRP